MHIDIKVRGYHLDLYKHVNNGRYLEFLEEGRWDYFDNYPFFINLTQDNLSFVVANINISYRRPAFAGETLRIVTSMGGIGNRSARMSQKVHLLKDGELADLVAEAEVTFCIMDNATEQAVVLAGEIREKMQQLLDEGR